MMKATICATAGAAILALSSLAANAYIACNGNVCWHVKERYTYPADARVVVHEDSWKWGPSERYTWREHEGRGYWRDNAWVTFGD